MAKLTIMVRGMDAETNYKSQEMELDDDMFWTRVVITFGPYVILDLPIEVIHPADR